VIGGDFVLASIGFAADAREGEPKNQSAVNRKSKIDVDQLQDCRLLGSSIEGEVKRKFFSLDG
jgi:hypothetical protein